MNNWIYLPTYIWRYTTKRLITVVLLALLIACGDQTPAKKRQAQNTSSVQKIEGKLTFNDINLEQADQQGQTVWKVHAQQATYSQDQKVALVNNPTGELFQDGKRIYQIQAQQGEIQQDGKRLFLKGDIVATDPKNGLVLRGNELEWLPQKDLLLVRNQLTGSHKQVQAVATEARVFSRKQRVELQGKVVANTTEPTTQLRTEQLVWLIQEQRFIAPGAVAIDRYKNKQISERATANAGEFNLKTKIATLKQNAQLALVQPPTQVTSNLAIWDLNAETVTTPQPVRVVDYKQQTTVTANAGRMDLQKQIVYLTGNVNALGRKRQTLKSQTLTWFMPTQLVEAEGDVAYKQVQPPISFTGQKAVGKLQDQNIVVSGGRVVTEIIP